MTARKPKRPLDEWPAIGLGPLVMQRQPSPEKDREAVVAWGGERIVAYTRATLDSTFLALHLRMGLPIPPVMVALLADVAEGRIKVRPKAKKKWLSPDALAAFKHWHDVNRARLEEGDAGHEDFARALNALVDRKGDRTKAAWKMTATIFGISPREAKKLYWLS